MHGERIRRTSGRQVSFSNAEPVPLFVGSGQFYYATCLPSSYLRSTLAEELVWDARILSSNQTSSLEPEATLLPFRSQLRGWWGVSTWCCVWTAGRPVWWSSPVSSVLSQLRSVCTPRLFWPLQPWECSPDEPVFTTCLLRSAHRKLERKNVRLKTQGKDFCQFLSTSLLYLRKSTYFFSVDVESNSCTSYIQLFASVPTTVYTFKAMLWWP